MAENLWVLNANVGNTAYLITASISPNGQAWGTSYDLANLPGCPLLSPSLTYFSGKVHIAYQGMNNEIVIASSADGVNWTHYDLIAQGQGVKVYTNGAPPITAHANDLFVAYNDSNNHLVIQQTRDGSTQFNWSDPYDTGQTSSKGPSIEVSQGRLFIAFVQDSLSYPLQVFSSADGTTWTQPVDLNQTTWYAPSLAALGDTLFVSWVALPVVEGSSYINVASSTDGQKWSPYLNLNRAVGCAPSLGIGQVPVSAGAVTGMSRNTGA